MRNMPQVRHLPIEAVKPTLADSPILFVSMDWRHMRGVNTFGRGRAALLGVHRTVKPTRRVADALRDVTRRGDLVLDPFLGSGLTLLAAEETARTCIGIELDPGSVAVAIRRWQRRTGKDAVESVSGETFGVLADRCSDHSSKVQADVSTPVTDGSSKADRKDRGHG